MIRSSYWRQSQVVTVVRPTREGRDFGRLEANARVIVRHSNAVKLHLVAPEINVIRDVGRAAELGSGEITTRK